MKKEVSIGVAFVQTVSERKLSLRLKKRGRMQDQEIVARIEMFGGLLLELKHWHLCLENEEGEEPLEYLESRYNETLDVCREFRLLLIMELNEYVENCKRDNEPIDISFYRIKKDLEQNPF